MSGDMSTVFRIAAELIKLNHSSINYGCCGAIHRAVLRMDPHMIIDGRIEGRCQTMFRELYQPPHAQEWWWPLGEAEPRRLALLFAAEIAESEGR